MKEFDGSELNGIELAAEDNIIAYCHTCKKVIFVGNNTSRVSNIVLKKQIFNHLEWFTELHNIDIVQPKTTPHKITEATTFVVAPWLTHRKTKLN